MSTKAINQKAESIEELEARAAKLGINNDTSVPIEVQIAMLELDLEATENTLCNARSNTRAWLAADSQKDLQESVEHLEVLLKFRDVKVSELNALKAVKEEQAISGANQETPGA